MHTRAIMLKGCISIQIKLIHNYKIKYLLASLSI